MSLCNHITALLLHCNFVETTNQGWPKLFCDPKENLIQHVTSARQNYWNKKYLSVLDRTLTWIALTWQNAENADSWLKIRESSKTNMHVFAVWNRSTWKTTANMEEYT